MRFPDSINQELLNRAADEIGVSLELGVDALFAVEKWNLMGINSFT